MHIQGSEDSLSIPSGLLISAGLSPSFVAKLTFFIAVILLWTVSFGKVCNKLFKMPSIAGQIIGGIILGPSLINIAHWSIFSHPIALIDPATDKLYAIVASDLMVFFVLLLSSAITVSYLLWIAGHETDVHDIWSIGLTAVTAGIFGAVFPIVITAALLYFGFSGWTSLQSIGVGIIFAATSVSIPVAMLFSYGKMHLKSSKATLGAAVIDDILAVVLLSVYFLSIQSGLFGMAKGLVVDGHGETLSAAILAMVFTFLAIGAVGYYLIPPFIRWLRDSHLSHFIAPAAEGIMLLFFSFAELVGGLAGITGAYFAGLFHRQGDPKHKADKIISPFVNAILLPLFLGSIGLQIDMRILGWFDWFIVFALLAAAILSKLLGCWVATTLSNAVSRKGVYRWRNIDTFLFGSSMVARGEVGLVVATVLYGSRVVTPEQYVIAVVVIVLTTIASPVMLAIGFKRLDETPVDQSEILALNLGLFPVIGTTQMFNIIVGRIEASGAYKTTVRMSEGRKIVNIEGQRVEIILCPEEGILFKGDQNKINDILFMVKHLVNEDVDRLSLY